VRRGVLAACALLAAGCAYYNGLYNANRLAGDARRAEREGRPGEARSLWAQAAVKAESVATRFQGSKWRDDALLLWGQALYHTESCPRAVRPLRAAADSSTDAAVRDDARLLLGECLVLLGQADSAVTVLTPLTVRPDAAAAARPRLWRGRAYVQLGRHDDAVPDLQAALEQHQPAHFDLAFAYAGLGATAAAAAVLEARLSAPYEEDRWLAALDSLGRRAPDHATRLVDVLRERPDLTPGQRARLLLADGRRWRGVGDVAPAAERFEEAVQAAPDSAAGLAASGELAMAQTPDAEVQDVSRLLGMLEAARQAGAATGEMILHGDILRRVLQARTDEGGSDQSLAMFMAAEAVRDTLAAPQLAAGVFLQMPQRYPQSPLVPKALLAAAMLRPEMADSLVGVLQRVYPESPYTRALWGAAGIDFVILEDSIRTAILGPRAAPERRSGEIRRLRRGVDEDPPPPASPAPRPRRPIDP
jgi:tetratricopeptide (TPR) repeat protein